MSDDSLERAKRLLPLPALMQRLGDHVPTSAKEAKTGFLINSPLREDRNPSFSVYLHNGEWRWSDKATGDGGDVVSYLQHRDGLDFKAAKAKLLDLAGVIDQPPPTPSKPSSGVRYEPKKTGDWSDCLKALTRERALEIAEWRGYPVEFVEWCRDQGWLGWFKGGPALPVHVGGKVKGVHHRTIDDPKSWRNTAGKSAPLVFGDPVKAPMTVLVESQWDAMAALASMDVHNRPDIADNIAFIATRGADNVGPVREILATMDLSKPRLCAIEQNDPPREDGKPTGNETWRKKIGQLVPGILFNAPPEEHKDLNDWFRAGMKGGDVIGLMMESKKVATSTFCFRDADEFFGMKFDDSDNYLGDRMLCAGNPTSFLGPGGVGKSRLVLQLAICCILGRPFLGLETHAKGKKWLIFQTENNNRRIQKDLVNLSKAFELGESEIKMIGRCLRFYTLEQDNDGFIDMENPENAANLEAGVFDYQPDFVVVDPLNTFTSGDLNSDRDCASVLVKLFQAIKKGNPNRVPFIVHHSITGKAGAMKATGWDKSSYGRNSKVLYGKVRSQWNIGKADGDDESRLILACGKNNDGAHFPTIGVIFDEGLGIYRVDPDFSEEEYRDSVTSTAKREKTEVSYSIDDILRNMSQTEPIRTAKLQKLCREECGISERQFYRFWNPLKETSRVFDSGSGWVKTSG